MDIKKIEKLMELMKSHQLAEIEVDEKGDRVRISMASSVQVQHYAPAPYAPAPAAPSAAPAAPAASPAAPRKTIRSPFVGTFYTASSPGTPGFVKPGQRVKKGDTLCIIEAMKLMNEIEAEAEVTITQILVENGNPVEFDQPLFAIE